MIQNASSLNTVTKVLVLAGGYGTRLKSVVSNVPKALAPVGNVPFLQLQLKNWLGQGLREFVFLLHHQADQIIDFLDMQRMGLLKGCQVNCIIEQTPLNTGGAIANAVNKLALNTDFLVANADTWLGGGIDELMRFPSPAISVVHLSDVSRYGRVEFDQDNHVTTFKEKDTEIDSGWINAGMSYLTAELFRNWSGQPFSLEQHLFKSLVEARRLTAVPLKADFIDIGIPSDYQRFCLWSETGRLTSLCN